MLFKPTRQITGICKADLKAALCNRFLTGESL